MMRFMSGISAGMMAAILSLAMAPEALGQNAPVFQQTLDVGIKDPLILDVTLSKGDVNFTYRHEGQIIIYVSPKNAADGNAVKDYLKTGVLIEQDGSHITIHNAPKTPSTGAA